MGRLALRLPQDGRRLTATSIMVMDIIPREAWSQIEPRRIELTTPRRLFLHHSVGGAGVPDRDNDGDSGDDYLRIVERHHIETNGWDDIAYNFAIDPIGLEVYELQGWGREPNAQAGFNEETWAVVIIGDFRSGHRHPDDYPGLLERIAELVAYGQSIGELPDVDLEGHRDAPGSEGNHCPGDNLYASLPEINQLIGDDMGHPYDGHKAFRKDHDIGSVPDWSPWDKYVEAGGSSVPESGTWAFTRADMAWVWNNFIRPLESKVAQLTERVRQLEDRGHTEGVSEAQVKAIIDGSQIVAPD